MRILVIDDSKIQRKLITRIISEISDRHEVIEAADGDEALALLNVPASDIRLILCDWNMPKMLGIDFLKEFVKLAGSRDKTVIMVTTEGSQKKKAQAREVCPGVGFIIKPFAPEELQEMVGPLLKN